MDYKLSRTFIAVPVSERLFNLQEKLKATISEKKGKIRWLRKDQLHLTLKFLGDTTEDSINDVRRIMQNIADEFKPFNVSIQKTGCFPKIERPRVMWVGVSGELAKLDQLVERIQKKLNPLGFPKDEKKYYPHITIARAKYPQKKTPDISTFLDTSFDPIPFQIKKVQFISSELFPNGPVYTCLLYTSPSPRD